MRKKVVVLGAGMVGRAMAIDLSKQHDVLSVDRDESALALLSNHPNLGTASGDLADASTVTKVIADADIVVGAVPGFMGYDTLRTVIEAGKHIVDISFFPEDPFDLDVLAKSNGVIAVMDAGVAPGMSNLILGSYQNEMDVTDFTCYVGGLPKERTWPYEYKAPFSPIDVIAEYTRPSRIVENSEIVEKVALSEPELIDFQGVGTLEAFNTDGLRSLIHTMKIPNMKEKTLRYPGHIELMRILRETGFFGEQKLQIGDQSVRPLDLTTALLFPKWKLGEEEEEFTIMNILIEGLDAGKKFKHKYELLDHYDPSTKTSSMARTTGYTCTAVTQLVLDGQYDRKGISPPEFVGEALGCLDTVFNYLEARGVIYKKSSQEG
ncbi:MAG: saccharopine dehydrogenase NADP-binding domain-containing protein [Candidatus Marinimicrobia bacterium]|nr:saccharopine dehydrogenase NADP-binding domain-containing protein [Candidatus Neomarinimicrobiota bacterium]